MNDEAGTSREKPRRGILRSLRARRPPRPLLPRNASGWGTPRRTVPPVRRPVLCSVLQRVLRRTGEREEATGRCAGPARSIYREQSIVGAIHVWSNPCRKQSVSSDRQAPAVFAAQGPGVSFFGSARRKNRKNSRKHAGESRSRRLVRTFCMLHFLYAAFFIRRIPARAPVRSTVPRRSLPHAVRHRLRLILAYDRLPLPDAPLRSVRLSRRSIRLGLPRARPRLPPRGPRRRPRDGHFEHDPRLVFGRGTVRGGGRRAVADGRDAQRRGGDYRCRRRVDPAGGRSGRARGRAQPRRPGDRRDFRPVPRRADLD